MKKALMCLICLSLVSIGFTKNSKVNANDNNTMIANSEKYSFNGSLAENETMYNKYTQMVKQKETKKTRSNYQSAILQQELPDDIKNSVNADFKELKEIQTLDFNTEIIDSSIKEDNSSAIIYEKNNDTYFYVESNNNRDNLLFFVNNDKYIIERENENYYLIAENGNKLPFIETEYLDQKEPFPVTSISSPNIMSRASWIAINTGTNYYHKTNKTWVTVLGIISSVTGGLAFKIKHPILGVISFISGTVATVGDQLFATLYIEYKQLYRSDCTSYILEYDWYYQYSNYTDLKGINSWNFHSVRPDYAGQNCMIY